MSSYLGRDKTPTQMTSPIASRVGSQGGGQRNKQSQQELKQKDGNILPVNAPPSVHHVANPESVYSNTFETHENESAYGLND